MWERIGIVRQNDRITLEIFETTREDRQWCIISFVGPQANNSCSILADNSKKTIEVSYLWQRSNYQSVSQLVAAAVVAAAGVALSADQWPIIADAESTSPSRFLHAVVTLRHSEKIMTHWRVVSHPQDNNMLYTKCATVTVLRIESMKSAITVLWVPWAAGIDRLSVSCCGDCCSDVIIIVIVDEWRDDGES